MTASVHYPLLCWPLANGQFLGRLLFTPYSAMESGAKKLRSELGARVKRELIQAGELFPPPIDAPQLKVVRVTISPSHRSEDSSVLAPRAVTISIPAVWGQSDDGYFLCVIPDFDYHLYVYEAKKIEATVLAAAVQALAETPPEDLYRLALRPLPTLDVITVRFPDRDETADARAERLLDEGKLAAVADPYPRPRAVTHRKGALPEAAWERSALVEQVVLELTREYTSLLLVGEPGTGKSVILADAAGKVLRARRDDENPARRLWHTSARRLIAGAKYLGDWQERCEELFGCLARLDGILWISDFVELIRAGGHSPEDSVAAFMTPFLADGRLQVVAEVRPRELDAAQAMLPAFTSRFRRLLVPDMDRAQVMRVLDQLGLYTAESLGVTVGPVARQTAYRLMDDFARYQAFPGKVVALLGKCIERAKDTGSTAVSPADVVAELSQSLGMAENLVRDDVPLTEAAIRSHFAERIIGQTQPIDAFCQALLQFKSGLCDPRRPIATLLFTGPTGVGKTAAVRALGELMHGRGSRFDPLVRLDMSEYQHAGQVERLIGTRTSEPSKLIRDVRERPYGVLLLDEIEKAHASIFDALLGLLDEGVLHDAYGRVTDFRSMIIVMTSNLGAEKGRAIGFGDAGGSNRYLSSVREFFRPELVNRLDHIVVFQPLTEEHVRAIATRELGLLGRREGLSRHHLKLTFTDGVRDLVVRRGFDPELGARPLQRAIERLVVAPLTRFLLQRPGLEARTLALECDGERVYVR
ncbi:MAG: ATP-dependent Clp protease ATP-binding subunit [Candidatus Schekmanbacteria bacterium]|nr:ATP-dependent Clp protease ATP-binding subunit [Candidatus Schekmanbacteria bacterium]